MNQLKRSRETWATQLGVILAVMGSAVGLGNFLRFPGIAAKYGGVFMIPYITAFLLLGLPLAWAEWATGRYGGTLGYNSAPGIYRKIWKNRFAPYVGIVSVLIPVVIYMYYVYIEGWCLAYAMRYLTGMMQLGDDPANYQTFFSSFVGSSGDESVIDTTVRTAQDTATTGSILNSAGFFLVICFALNFFLIYRGLTKGIEWFCKWAMPALIVCALVVMARVLTLGTPDAAHPDQNLMNGLGYMWNPTAEGQTVLGSMMNPKIWLESAGQIFFSLSVGFGIIITYSSYTRRDDDIALASLTASAGNGFCEVVLGGLICIPAAFIFLGMPFIQDVRAGEVGTFGLGFITLPNVFNHMSIFGYAWGGQLIGFLFFFLLFLAAVTSSLSMLQPAIALLEEGLGLNRKASVALLGFITACGAWFVVYHSKDLAALDTLDFWVGTVCIYVVATFQVILFGWVLGIDRGMEELERGAEIRIPRLVRFVIKYVSPTYLLLVFGLWLFSEFAEPLLKTHGWDLQLSQIGAVGFGTWFRDMVATPLSDPTTPAGKSYLGQIVNNAVVRQSLLFIVGVAVLFGFLIAQSVRRWRRLEAAGEATGSSQTEGTRS